MTKTIWVVTAEYNIAGKNIANCRQLSDVLGLAESIAEAETELLPELINDGYDQDPCFIGFRASQYVVGVPEQENYPYLVYDKDGSLVKDWATGQVYE